MRIQKIFDALSGNSFTLSSEKNVQQEMWEIFKQEGFKARREYRLSPRDIVDFLIDDEIAVEVKIGGGAEKTFRQCERYVQYEKVKAFILATNKSMGFPEEINGKPCYYFSLSRGML